MNPFDHFAKRQLGCRAYLRYSEGFPFLGFIIYPEHRRLKRRKGVFYQRKLHSLVKDYCERNISFEDVTASVQGWVNHVRYADTWGLRKAILRTCNL